MKPRSAGHLHVRYSMSYPVELLKAFATVCIKLLVAIPIGTGIALVALVIGAVGGGNGVGSISVFFVHILVGWSLRPLQSVKKFGELHCTLVWMAWGAFCLWYGSNSLLSHLAVFSLATLVVGGLWVLPRATVQAIELTNQPNHDDTART